MKNYDIIELDSENKEFVLVVICNSNSPYDYLPQIVVDLQEREEKRRIIVDQILHVGNTENRFLTLDLSKKDYSVIEIPKCSSVRKVACEYLKDMDYIDYTILSSIQKRMIKKGITI